MYGEALLKTSISQMDTIPVHQKHIYCHSLKQVHYLSINIQAKKLDQYNNIVVEVNHLYLFKKKNEKRMRQVI
jgi:hypothetical protein